MDEKESSVVMVMELVLMALIIDATKVPNIFPFVLHIKSFKPQGNHR